MIIEAGRRDAEAVVVAPTLFPVAATPGEVVSIAIRIREWTNNSLSLESEERQEHFIQMNDHRNGGDHCRQPIFSNVDQASMAFWVYTGFSSGEPYETQAGPTNNCD